MESATPDLGRFASVCLKVELNVAQGSTESSECKTRPVPGTNTLGFRPHALCESPLKVLRTSVKYCTLAFMAASMSVLSVQYHYIFSFLESINPLFYSRKHARCQDAMNSKLTKFYQNYFYFNASYCNISDVFFFSTGIN